jgi:hypothetical protein
MLRAKRNCYASRAPDTYCVATQAKPGGIRNFTRTSLRSGVLSSKVEAIEVEASIKSRYR